LFHLFRAGKPVKDFVKQYYGQILKTSNDLATDACCTNTPTPAALQAAMSRIHPEVSARYYGCGLVAPTALQGRQVLDLGSGSGRDCYLLAQLVGEQGAVTGVDMTEEQLQVANRHLEWHRVQFGYQQFNVRFLHGHIEALDQLDLADEQFDVIVSNCVINLSPDKPAVLREAWRVLKTGGELYFSDVYADRRVPAQLTQDPLLYGECLGGALYWNDFLQLARQAGFSDPRLVEDRPLTVGNAQLAERLAPIRFFSATYRLFKLPQLDPGQEDYGQAAVYRGGIAEQPDCFVLDKRQRLEKGRVTPISGNSFRMLAESRFRDYFDLYGDFDNHFGIFAADGSLPFDETRDDALPPAGGSGCC
jgi:arsenite methyltransferase